MRLPRPVLPNKHIHPLAKFLIKLRKGSEIFEHKAGNVTHEFHL